MDPILDPRYKTSGNADPGTGGTPTYVDPAGGMNQDALGQGVGNLDLTKKVAGGTLYTDASGNQRFVQDAPAPVAPVKVPGVSDVPMVSDGTGKVRQQTQQEIEAAKETINRVDTSTAPPASTLDTLKTQLVGINSTTDDELKQIEDAGKSAGSEYDPKIADAMQSRRTTLGANIVRAGQAGGFENTQYGGRAAIAPTTGQANGENFVGSGGLLDQSRIVLDRNISLLQIAKQNAIAAAQAATRKAIKDGKRESYTAAYDLAKLTEEINNNLKDREMQQKNLDLNTNKYNLDVAQEQRNAITGAFQVMKDNQAIIDNIPEGSTQELFNPLTGKMVTFEGVKQNKPFYTSSDITQMKLKLDKGEVVKITDPNTGKEIVITGIIDQPDKTQSVTSDDGVVRMVKPDGKGGMTVVAQTAPGWGKTKTQAANVTLNLTQGQSDALSAASKKLNSTKGVKNGTTGDTFYNTDAYIEEREKYGATPGADTNDFDLQYSWNLNPADPKASQILNNIGKSPKKKSASEAIGEALGKVKFEDK